MSYQINKSQKNSSKNNFIQNSTINQLTSSSQNSNNFEKNIELINNLNNFFSISTNIAKSNEYLCNLITWSNSSSFTYCLLNPVNIHLKLFSSNSLLFLFTNNYTEIEIDKAQTIFESLLNHVFQHRDSLYQMKNSINNINNNIIQNNKQIINDTNNNKIVMNSIIKLITRIIRVFYPQCNYFKKFDTIIITKSLIYNKDSNSIKLIATLFTEIIYQFQTNFELNKNTIKMTKYFGTLEEFKEGPLINIFNYISDVVTSIIGHKIPTDNFNDILQLSQQIVLCLEECLNYSEDSNIKEEDYNKYEIKPTHIPSPRRRGKDKKLNINYLLNICQNLFDLYNMILNYISSENNNNQDNINENSGSLNYFDISEGVLKVLNYLVCMKIQYLDNNKGRILNNYSSNLGSILYYKYGYIHHEYLCQIIYRLKKNYNYIDLTTENETFWSLIFPYIENSINLISNKVDLNTILSSNNTNIKNTIIDNFTKNYLPGTLYLLRFLGYFSHNLYKISLNFQMKMKQFILSICKKMMEMNYLEYQSDMNDICKSFGICGEGVYIQVLENIISYIKNDYKNKQIVNLCFKIKFGIEVLKINYQYIQEKRLANKKSENELESFSEIDLSDDKPEINAIVNFINCVFDIIKDIFNGKNNNIYNNINNFGLLSNILLKFLKFFCKNFLSKYLSNSFIYIINNILNDNDSKVKNQKEKYAEDLIVFIFNILVDCIVKNGQKENKNNLNNNSNNNINNYTVDNQLINNKIILEILKILYNNFTFETDYSTKICQFQTLNILNNNNFNQTTNSKIVYDNSNDNDNDLSLDIESFNSSSQQSFGTSTPQAKSNLFSNESINSVSKSSYSQKIHRNNFRFINNLNVNKNHLTNLNSLNTINEKDEITINSVEIHLGKIRLNQDKLINILKDLFNHVIVIEPNILPLKTKKYFMEFLFKIFFQCYLPFESAMEYFIDQLTKLNANDITEYIYIINSMISSVTSQENYQILIDTLLPSIQKLCSSITAQTNINNNNTLFSLKKMLKLLKDITDYEKSYIKSFSNNSQSPIHIFTLIDNLLEYYINLANNINIKNFSENIVYFIQIKPISYIVQIYYNLFSYYIQAPLFINTNYTYVKKLFYKISKIIFSLDIKSLIGYCDKFKKFMKLLKIIYCDYIIQNYGLITNINNVDYCDMNDFICDINYIPNILQFIKCLLNEDYLDIQCSENKDNANNNYDKLKIHPITNSGENIRECFKEFNEIIYEWCKLYIQYIKDKDKQNINNNINGEIKDNNQINNILSINNNNENNNINSISNNAKILLTIFTNNNINLLLNDILFPLLQGIILNYYTSIELNSLSKTIFILGYSFQEQYINIFQGIINSNIIKQFYSEEEINIIKNNLEQLNIIEINKIVNNGNNNNLTGFIDSFYNIFKEKLNQFSNKIESIIISRKKDIIELNNNEFFNENMLD